MPDPPMYAGDACFIGFIWQSGIGGAFSALNLTLRDYCEGPTALAMEGTL